MPHPYKGAETPDFGPRALLRRPELAAHIGAIATSDEMIQESWGIILAVALSADARIGTELYLSLTGSAAQATLLNKAVELALEGEPELQSVYAELIKMTKGRSGERNRVVHGRWGSVASQADFIVLGERNWLPKAVARLTHYYERELAEGEEWALEPPEYACTKYVKKDFENILERQDAFLLAQHRFIELLRELQTKRRDQRLEKRRQREDWLGRGPLTVRAPGNPIQPETNREEPG